MATNKYNFLLALIICISGVQCGDFGDLNVDPNTTTEITPETLLTSSLAPASIRTRSIITVTWSQYISQNIYTGISRYNTVNGTTDFFYFDPLISLETIIQLNTDDNTREEASFSGSNNNQIAVARILKSMYFHLLTDLHGPIPYSEALQGRENFEPVYDSQEDVYNGIFEELTEAVDQFDDGPPVRGDYLLNGDNEHWKKFANSMRMIAALRISKVDPQKGKDEFIKAMNAGVFTSNGDNVMYPFLADANNENWWFTTFRRNVAFSLSNTLVDKLKALNDPRLYAYGDPAITTGEYRGMPYGIANPTLDPADVSFPHVINVRGQDTPLPLFTYAQILFSRAEAAHLGWTNENAEDLYYEAIKASMDQWGAYDDATFGMYIDQETVKWDPQNGDKLLGEQKWIALFMQGHEAWAEWRRTGYPELLPAPDAVNKSKQIPVRLGYPISERDLNHDNWKYAVDTWLNGEDGLDSRLWWDVD